MWLEILVANLATNFQDLVAKMKNLVALAPVLGAILRPGRAYHRRYVPMWVYNSLKQMISIKAEVY